MPAKKQLVFPVSTREKVKRAGQLLSEMAKIREELREEGIGLLFVGVRTSENDVEFGQDARNGEIVVVNVNEGKSKFRKGDRITLVNGALNCCSAE